MKGNAVTLEGSQDADVGDAARETSTERQPDARRGHGGWTLSQPLQTIYRRVRGTSSSHSITARGDWFGEVARL
jgi:hypothetical protein